MVESSERRGGSSSLPEILAILPQGGAGSLALPILGEISVESVKALVEGMKGLGVAVKSARVLQASPYPALELGVDCHGDREALRRLLFSFAEKACVDCGLFERAERRLLVMDMDSTVIQAEVIDELARQKGVYDEVAAITRAAMEGKLNFDQSLRQRCAKLKGLSLEEFGLVADRIKLMDGAETLIRGAKALGMKVALISGGFMFMAERLKQRLGLDSIHANTLEVRDGVLTGEVIPPIVNAEAKAALLLELAKRYGHSASEVMAIGDGANDALMLGEAGLGVAFHAKAVLREKADFALSYQHLGAALFLLGRSREQLREAGVDLTS